MLGGLRNLGCFFWKRKWKIAFVTASFATLVALVAALATYHYHAAWNGYEKNARARGEKLTMPELALPPVPDDQNFAMTPLLKAFFASQGDKSQSSAQPHFHLSADVEMSEPTALAGYGYDGVAAKTVLQQWTEYFQKTNALEQLKKQEGNMAEISASLLRPYSRFPIDYNKKPAASILIPQVGALISLAKLYHMRCFAELAAGKNSEAMEDVLTLLRLSRAGRDEPFLISKLTSISISGMSSILVWVGLATHCWNDGQLAALQAEIEKSDMMPEFLRALEGERVFFCDTLLYNAQLSWWGRVSVFNNIFKSMTGKEPGVLMDAMAFLSASRFAIYRALVIGNASYDSLFSAINVSGHQINPVQVEEIKAAAKNLSKAIPGNGFLIEFLPNVCDCMSLVARAQASLDHAEVACALERYLLAKGAYPEKLDGLAPQFIPKLPHDLITGGPLHYQRTPDGLFVLYSIGWDGKDHGGDEGKSSEGEPLKDFNWAWKYSAQ